MDHMEEYERRVEIGMGWWRSGGDEIKRKQGNWTEGKRESWLLKTMGWIRLWLCILPV